MKEDIQKELIKALEDYQALILEEYSELASIAHIRGWKSTRVEQGIALRQKIADIKEKLVN